MIDPTKYIWMNVTTSKNWTRPPVGIVRVEQSLCNELSNLLGKRLRLCVWDGESFVELKDDLFKSTIDNDKTILEKNKSYDQSELPLIYPQLSSKQAIKNIVQALLSLAPKKIQQILNKILYVIRHYFITKLRNVNESINLEKNSESFKIIAEDRMRHPFSSGDVLISLGLDWEYSYYKSFYKLRKYENVKVVTCCYDLIPVVYPQYCVNDVANIFTSYFNEIVDGSDLVLCISKQSEKDLLDMLHSIGGANAKTKVITLGDNVAQDRSEIISPLVENIITTNFILYVSTIERRKNHEVLYRAYHLLCEKGLKDIIPTLVFVGMPGWGVDELLKDMDLDPKISGKILRLDHVNDTELNKLMQTSLFCVYPSLYEGWGLPVAEALSLGKAVLSSSRGSLPEVGGSLVRYIDPWNPQQWSDEILRMSTDHEWRISIETNAKLNYNSKSWNDAAIDVKNSIEILLED